MSLLLGVVADDYTGASDLANALTRNGLSTIQTIGVPSPDLQLPDVDAIVVALKTRSIAADMAVEKSVEAARWMKSLGAEHILFKVCSTFDSTDAGNIGPVTDALAALTGESVALVNPSFPENRRTVYQGHLFVGDRPLDESPLRDHPLNPMHDADLVRVLGRQSRRPVGLIDLQTVLAGREAIEARRNALASEGIGAAIVDAITESELNVIGEIAARMALSVGASGIGIGIARALVARGSVKGSNTSAAFAPIGGPAVCLAGSCSRATLAQVQRAEAVMPVLHLDVEDVLGLGSAIEAAIAWAGERIGSGPVLIASSADAAVVETIQSRHGRARAGHAIESAMAALAVAMAARGVHRLVVAGGETSGAVVDRLGLKAFLIGAEIAPGVPVLISVGGRDRFGVVLKSGNFGGPDFFADALKAIA
ncbi:MAG: four-carbon acid sugar kinase family protein [Ancalomicrobiaceae bacterium]|nr:four-carbon acid sugar kinase family protein [Ancalomicrobiaceae bacterium]